MSDPNRGVTLTLDELKGVLAELQRNNSVSLIEAIRELKAPSPEEVEKRRLDAEVKEKQRQAMIVAAKEEIAAREAAQSRCNHRKPDGTINYGGQVHGDLPGARVRLICKTCFKEIVSRPATSDDIQHGPLELLVENQPVAVRII